MFISNCIAVISAVMLCYSASSYHRFGKCDYVCLTVGLWLAVEILSDLITLQFSQEAYAADSVVYFFTLSVASLIFLYETNIKRNYPETISRCFMVITVACVLMAFYRWVAQSRWDDGGAEFYYSYGIMLDSAFVYSIVAMDALMIILGVYSALATSTNTDDSMGGERR